MDYKVWADEYFTEAKEIEKLIDIYKQQLKASGSVNRERINSLIYHYRILRGDLIHTGNLLLERGKED